MRLGFERLTFFVKEKHRQVIDEGNLFLFLGTNRKRLKILYFDGSGLILLVKRMEKGNFMNVSELSLRAEISMRDLKLILRGSVLREFHPRTEKK